MNNTKSHTRFRLMQRSSTLDDLEVADTHFIAEKMPPQIFELR